MRKFLFILFTFLFLGNILYVFVAISLWAKSALIHEKESKDSQFIENLFAEKNDSLFWESTLENIESDKNPETLVEENNSQSENAISPTHDAVIYDDIQTYSNTVTTNDTFYHLQHYLNALNIPEAWNNVNNKNKVIVAVIDDGVNINHPDLTNNIWVEKGASYGSSKIKNFTWDDLPDNFPTGKHGTMVSGIIGATTNNSIWIAGIAKNVEIMPLRVFDVKGEAKGSSVINAIYYAMNNKANIINLSLWQNQFVYSTEYDNVIKMAYEKGIVVVIAWGNGDVLSLRNSGINTTVNPVSPVCNNSWKQVYSIGVWSLNRLWDRARWSNYGSCISIFAPGENIFSTSVAVFNKEYGVDYDTDSGTSFSAPMISGIIALGFNEFGYVPPDIVYESLKDSLTMNPAGNNVIDAARYIQILRTKKSIIRERQISTSPSANENTNSLSTPMQTKKLSDMDYFMQNGYIENRDFSIDNSLNRGEMITFALKFPHLYAPKSYTCRGIFSDISSSSWWLCGTVEYALERWIITQNGNYFYPEKPLTLVEAVGVLLKASGIKIQQYSGGEFEPWQTNVIGTVFSLWLVDEKFDFPISKIATWKDVFAITRRIIEVQK